MWVRIIAAAKLSYIERVRGAKEETIELGEQI